MCLQDFFMFLPDMCTLVLWNKELVALLDVECLVPCIHHWEGTIHTSLVWRVNIHGHQILQVLRTGIACSYTCPCQEEALFWSKSILHTQLLCLHHILKCTESRELLSQFRETE